MKIEKLTYSRKFNLGSYESEDFGIEMFLEDGESFKEANEALAKAKKLIAVNSTQSQRERAEAKAAISKLEEKK